MKETGHIHMSTGMTYLIESSDNKLTKISKILLYYHWQLRLGHYL